VQGVGFRNFVREQARTCDIAGWVRNLSSGNLEVAATGSEEGIRAFMDAVRVGPTGATVKQIITLALQTSLEFPRPFTILK
jgi:acylphosphatase